MFFLLKCILVTHTILSAFLMVAAISEDNMKFLKSIAGIHGTDESVKNCIFKFERIIPEYPVPSQYKGKIVTRKYNRTTTVMDVYHEVITPLLPGLTKISIKAFQFLSNTYRLSSIQLQVDYCMILEAGSFGIKDFSNDSNYPNACPIKPGKYLTKNGLVPSDAALFVNSIPKNFLGKWKLVLDYQLAGKTMYIYNYYFEVIKKVTWKKN